ncbi:MAG: S9 family peptidase [Candidatus Eremiobacteraeota bacterium]|nr:S9 family peptidase [Candidatus Eremiobacteraeota bacterium]
MNKHVLTALAFALVLPANAPAAARTFTIDDLPKIVGVTSATIAPDGKSIAYVVSRSNMKADNFDRQIDIYDVATKTSRAVTFERKDLSSPAFSPTGDRLAFLAQRGSGEDAHQQIYVMDFRGGDPVAITNAPEGVEQFAWRPDGKAIAYVAPDKPADESAKKKHLDAFVVGDQAYDDREAPTSSHIWLVDADGTNDRRLTEGTWSVPSAQPPSSPGPPLSWSPDGKFICFTRMPNAYDADSDQAVVAILDLQSKDIRVLTQHGKYEGFGEWSPDGKNIAYWYPNNGDPAALNDIFVAPASGGNGVDVTAAEIDTNVQRAMWMPDGKTLLVSGHKNTDAALWLKPLDGPAKRIKLGGVQPTQAFWLDASIAKTGAIAFVGSEANRPGELYYMASADATPQRVTSFNDEIASLSLGTVKTIAWTNDGFDEDGTVTLPPSYDSSKAYPLVLIIHGGPNSASISSFSASNQLFAARGYIVFNPNYRGSDNLGAKYWYAIIKDAGAGPGRDVMAGIDAVEKAYPVDRSRIAVSGWSYGGYMTSWMIGHYHIWKTAVSGAAVNDWLDDYALADGGVGDRYALGGSPYINGLDKLYIEQSPISAAWNVTTPTLILSDVGDERVPITQSYKFFHALKDRGTTVEFWAYPVAGHFPADPVRSQDVWRRWIDWIDKYLQ